MSIDEIRLELQQVRGDFVRKEYVFQEKMYL